MHKKEHITKEFSALRYNRINLLPSWWLQKEAMTKCHDSQFLRCPWRVDRKTYWFYMQVCSGTLHTRKVVKLLYNDQQINQMCPKCGREEESALHCLVRCPAVIIARRKLAVNTSRQLNKLGINGSEPIDIWFDNKQWYKGKLTKTNTRKSSKDYLTGMMGMESTAVKQISQALILRGRKKEKAITIANTLVNNIKRRAVLVLHKLYIKSIEQN